GGPALVPPRRPMMQSHPPPAWTADAASLRLTADPATFGFERSAWESGPNHERIARAEVRVDGIPPGWIPTARMSGASLQVASGERLSGSAFGGPGDVPIAGRPGRGRLKVVAYLLGESVVDNSAPRHGSLPPLQLVLASPA